MKKNTTHIEQLYQELLSQDPSLVSQKSEILWLLERMTEHTPSVSIDPLFQKNLKSRLEHHIHYMHNLKANPPEVSPRINRLARLISYGLPAVALGVIIFLALPYNPTTAPIETTIDNYDSLPQKQWDNIPTTTIEDKPMIIQTKSQIPQQTEKIIPQDISVKQEETYKAEPMMLKTTSTPEWSETENTIINNTMMIEDTNLSKKPLPISTQDDFSQYNNWITNKEWQLDYNIAYDMQDTKLEHGIFIDGLLLIRSCNQSFVLDNPKNISNQPNLLLVEAKSDILKESHILTLTMENNQIIDIQWYEKLCQQ